MAHSRAPCAGGIPAHDAPEFDQLLAADEPLNSHKHGAVPMKIPTQKKQLTALFRKLGSRSAEGWASSQINEGIPQLQRFLFLRQAWARVIREEDESWIDQQVEHCEKSWASR
jgi:hypothetical protein